MSCPRLPQPGSARVTNAAGRGCCSPDTIHAANPAALSVTSAPAADPAPSCPAPGRSAERCSPPASRLPASQLPAPSFAITTLRGEKGC